MTSLAFANLQSLKVCFRKITLSLPWAIRPQPGPQFGSPPNSLAFANLQSLFDSKSLLFFLLFFAKLHLAFRGRKFAMRPQLRNPPNSLAFANLQSLFDSKSLLSQKITLSLPSDGEVAMRPHLDQWAQE